MPPKYDYTPPDLIKLGIDTDPKDDGAALSAVNANYVAYYELWHNYIQLLKIAKGSHPDE